MSLGDATFLGLSTAADTSESGFFEELGDLVRASDFRSLGFALASGFELFFALEPFLVLSSPKESFNGLRKRYKVWGILKTHNCFLHSLVQTLLVLISLKQPVLKFKLLLYFPPNDSVCQVSVCTSGSTFSPKRSTCIETYRNLRS